MRKRNALCFNTIKAPFYARQRGSKQSTGNEKKPLLILSAVDNGCPAAVEGKRLYGSETHFRGNNYRHYLWATFQLL